MVTSVESIVLATLVVLFGGCTWAFSKIFDRCREDFVSLQERMEELESGAITSLKEGSHNTRETLQGLLFRVAAIEEKIKNK